MPDFAAYMLHKSEDVMDQEERLRQLADIIDKEGPVPPSTVPEDFAHNGASHENEIRMDLHRAAVLAASTMQKAWLQAAGDTERCAQALFAVQTDLRAKMTKFSEYCKKHAPVMAEEVHRAVKTAANISQSMSSLTDTVDEQ
jgi:hypothetical protein